MTKDCCPNFNQQRPPLTEGGLHVTKQVVSRMSKWVEEGGSWKGHESGQAVFIILSFARVFAASSLSRAPDHHASQATVSRSRDYGEHFAGILPSR